MKHNTKHFPEERTLDLSLVCAVYNEGDSLRQLLSQLDEVFSDLEVSYELILVDDGSSDGSLALLKESLATTAHLRVVELYKNSGQVAALGAGMSVARGRFVVMMDGDLQHDPADVARLVARARAGHDLVATYRERRLDSRARRLVTWVGNRINRYLTGVPVRDFGSAFRLIDATLIDLMRDRRGHVHYNTPKLYVGARCPVEIPITQHRRPHGVSKWTLLMFITYNLDFITASTKLTQVLLSISLGGMALGVGLYFLDVFAVSVVAESASAPATIALTSLVLATLAVVWREVIQTQKLARGEPPFLIRTIWSRNQVPSDTSPDDQEVP